MGLLEKAQQQKETIEEIKDSEEIIIEEKDIEEPQGLLAKIEKRKEIPTQVSKTVHPEVASTKEGIDIVDEQLGFGWKKFGSKKHLWEKLRAYIDILIFETWEFLLEFALKPKKGLVKWAHAP